LLSLRSTDAVLTFNWDPFLFDVYQRNRAAAPLPKILFLHGNVRIGACLEHDRWGARNACCPDCPKCFTRVPLLYPTKQKNYSSVRYIRRSQEAAKAFFGEAFTITIFGYGAPDSDAYAVELLKQAWFSRSQRTFEHVEIIDTACSTCLHGRWSPFTPTYHYCATEAFEHCRIARWPRRSCEALLCPMTQGLPCEDFPLPNTRNLAELQTAASEIARHEAQLIPAASERC